MDGNRVRHDGASPVLAVDEVFGTSAVRLAVKFGVFDSPPERGDSRDDRGGKTDDQHDERHRLARGVVQRDEDDG